MIGNLSMTSLFGEMQNRLFGIPGYSYGGGSLPEVRNPDKAYADLTRREYMDFVNNYGSFEDQAIRKAQTDTSLIDQAQEDITGASALTANIQQRNIDRYGGQLTTAQQQQMEGALQRGNTLGGIQAMNDARIQQKELNQSMLADLINIGQGVNRSSQSQLGQSAANETARKNAYQQAKAQSKAQTYSTIGQLGGAAIAIMMMSDRRVKEDITKVGVSPSGVNIYEFKYKNTEGTYKGVMADEVPWAAAKAPNGYQMVDYNKVDVDFEKVA